MLYCFSRQVFETIRFDDEIVKANEKRSVGGGGEMPSSVHRILSGVLGVFVAVSWLAESGRLTLPLALFSAETSSTAVGAPLVLEYIFVMKIMASRSEDEDDIALLTTKLGMSNSDDVLTLIKQYVPEEYVTPDLVEEIKSRFD